MKMMRATFHPSELVLVGETPPPDHPPLGVGDYAEMNSGGGVLLVVDCDADNVVLAWPERNGAIEDTLPRACVRRRPSP